MVASKLSREPDRARPKPYVADAKIKPVRTTAMTLINEWVWGFLAVLAFQAPAQARTGSVRIEIYKAGFIVGVSGGKGTLILAGKQYPLQIGGVSLGATIGASKAELIGNAYNLENPGDIAGTYTAIEASVAVAGGARSPDCGTRAASSSR